MFASFRLKLILLIGIFALPIVSLAAEGGHGNMTTTLLWIAVILIVAKLSGFIEKFGQPPVLGELLTGVLLGNLVLVGVNFFEPIKTDMYIPFLAELGVIILLFQVGLESNIYQMKKVGVRAFIVATVGVIVPFVLGAYIVGPWIFPGLSTNTYLFLGAALTATSVGITARVFKDLNALKSPEAQIVLGAAVIDDVMGLIILAVVSALVTAGTISVFTVAGITVKAILFLVVSVVLGMFLAPKFGSWFSKIHSGSGMKLTLALTFALVFAYLAGEMGLAPIVGAFAAGLVLDPVHFKNFRRPRVVQEIEKFSEQLSVSDRDKFNGLVHTETEKHVENLIEPIYHFLVPIFFVVTGLSVKIETLFDLKILGVALGITAVAFAGKYVTGLVAGKVNKNIVGFGMVPRGEVGLIFATIGKSLGVIDDTVFSVIVIMVILTTLLTPPILTFFIKKDQQKLA